MPSLSTGDAKRPSANSANNSPQHARSASNYVTRNACANSKENTMTKPTVDVNAAAAEALRRARLDRKASLEATKLVLAMLYLVFVGTGLGIAIGALIWK